MSIAEQIKVWRKREGITQAQAAERLSTKIDTLQGWEQGRAQPRGLAKVALLGRIKPTGAAEPKAEPGEWD